MTVTEALLEKVNALPKVRQQEVLDFAEFLTEKENPKGPRRSLKGALSHLNIDADLSFESENADLSFMNENELTHLEMEFENYEEIYPLK